MFRLLVLCCFMSLPSARAAGLCSGNDQSCVLVTKCKPVMDMLRNKALSRETSVILHSLKCGYKRRMPRICCGQELELTTVVPTTTSTRSPSQEYPNWNLLPHDICGSVITPYVVGGRMAGLGELPWLALIFYLNRNGSQIHGCGGSLISKRYVLTAAHCVHNATLRGHTPIMVRLGEHDIDTDPDCQESRNLQQKYCADPVQDIPIEDIIIYNDYKGTSRNRRHDIALIRLKEDANMSRYVQPICLPTPRINDQIVIPDAMLTLAGWGRTDTGNPSTVKMKVGVPVLNYTDCRQSYNDTGHPIYNQQICAGTEGEDACEGDSGGPLMDLARGEMYPDMRFFVVGIVSYGPKNCGDGSKPAVYTKVSSYLKWILNNLQP